MEYLDLFGCKFALLQVCLFSKSMAILIAQRLGVNDTFELVLSYEIDCCDVLSTLVGSGRSNHNWPWNLDVFVFHTLDQYIVCSLCFLNLHPSTSQLYFLSQLTLPEGTQQRWAHSLTACRMGKKVTHTTTFGGCSSFKFDPNISDDSDSKLADTTVMEFGEWKTYRCILHWVALLYVEINRSKVH